MQLPRQITFRNLPHSDAVEAKINQQVEKLHRYCDRITNCHVVLTIPHHHHRQGNACQVRIDLTLPIKLVIDRNSSEQSPQNIYATINEAFAIAQRGLKEYSQMQRV
ncbi:MAG: ribosome-associated translation inhibitor RaiA [Hydrococcus sp. SU_1_0]|nr:ribosome-associated translation inhibitor RaiA [Hydrococcus sp. SU_1_0]